MKHAGLRLVPVSLLLVALAVSQVIGRPAFAQGSSAAQTTVAKASPTPAPGGGDPYAWLEDQTGARAMSWVETQNARTLPMLQNDSHYKALYDDAYSIITSKHRIAYPEVLNGAIYNFWTDDEHQQGIWRRTTAASYASDAPQWTTVLDFDALSKKEGTTWVFHGAQCNFPNEYDCLIVLSNGGEDAESVREFDLRTDSFVTGGFALPHGKQDIAWYDNDTLLVAREWTPGLLTKSGYPYVVKLLKRGAPLESATEIFRGKPEDVSDSAYTLNDAQGHKLTLIDRGVDFFNSEHYLYDGKATHQLGLPSKVEIDGLLAGRLIVGLNEDWDVDGKHFTLGSIVQLDAAAVAADPAHLHPTLVHAPGEREAVGGVGITRDTLLLVDYQNVRGRAFVYTPAGTTDWKIAPLALPDNSSIDIADTNFHDNLAYVSVTNFLEPTSLWSVDTQSGALAKVKALPALFDASNEAVDQYEATSSDGTKIPYFVVHPKNMALDGTNPTVLYAYGGFQIPLWPSYSATIGKLWLERNGVYVLANIRGGGEFGPAWHEAGLKTKRQIIYDDFYAVAKDLVARKITSPRHLGIMGGSNGGLLMGVEFTEHPDAWNAVDIEVPLLDMLNFEHIDAGASWVGEYGSNSVPAEHAFWLAHSPYQNLKAGTAYPEPLIWSTTKDDRVGPQHARKFAAKLAAMGVPYLYYEVIQGGHGAGANPVQDATTDAIEWTYFTKKLME
jgi:prolyl oligopeptidase